MREHGPQVFRPVAALALRLRQAESVTFDSRSGLLEISALAPDLFRLRVTAARTFNSRPSWAVCKTDWPPINTNLGLTRSHAVLETTLGRFTLRLADGGWSLAAKRTRGQPERKEREVFTSLPKLTGFSDKGCRLSLKLADGESLFGLGETTGTFNKRGLIREFWNIDVLGHSPGIHPSLRTLYVSIPFAMSFRNGCAAGLFWDNPARQTWDLGQTRLDEWRMQAGSGEIDLYLFLGPRPADVVARYTQLTGRMPMPPRWALGYQQCRYSYETRPDFEAIARTFRRRKIPCDALYLDIHHMDGYRVFTFGKTFPQPARMIAKLARQGFKVVAIVDPGVKDDPRYGVLKRGRAVNAFVKAPDGAHDFIGKVWPGESRFPDFLRGRVRAWWGDEQNYFQKLGVAGFWNDMNEPGDFTPPAKTLPDGCRHDTDFGPMLHAEAHNVYGSQMARASREGALRHQPSRRPFVITRAGYAGIQRHALVWTGDNTSAWEHLADAIQMCANLGLSGVAFCGADVGGFMDNTTPELLARWTQMAAFTPFFRNHSHIGTINQEPWAFSRPVSKGKGK